jgi:hypothetical protein
MSTLFDEQGNAVEALTPEEVEAKLDSIRQSAIEEANQLRQEEIDNLTTQMTEKETLLAVKEAELVAEKSKEKNLSGQRIIIGEKNAAIEKLNSEITELRGTMTTRLNELESKGQTKVVDDMIASVAGTDKELAAKVRLHYNSFVGVPENDEKMKERIKNAYTLATGGRINPLSGSILSGAGEGTELNPTGEKVSPEVQEFGKKMGISDVELKKHKLI